MKKTIKEKVKACLLLAGLTLAACGGGGGTIVVPPATSYIICSSTYALCTTALCTPIAGLPGFDSCSCSVQTGYSAGLTKCQSPEDTGEGQEILSRYYPLTSYAACPNDLPWANCLGSPCLVDPKNPSASTCICTEEVNQGPYIIFNASGEYSPSTCVTGLHSSATVANAIALTTYLQTHKTPLKPFPITVYNPPS